MKISTILDQIENGQMALPEFQRGYVWNRDQVRDLMDSLYHQNPIGSLLVWVTEVDTAKKRGDMDGPAGMVELLLDGQQRMTSLYGIIRGQEPVFFDGNAAAFTGLYFNMETEEFSFYMQSKMKNDPLWIDVTRLMKAGHNGLGEIAQNFADDPLGLQTFISKYNGRISKLLNIKERDLHIEKITGKDKTLQIVVDIFNKVNSGGTKLSAGDLALAKVCSNWSNARQEMKEVIADWKNSGYEFDLVWLLRIVNADLTGEANFVHLHNKGSDEVKDSLKRSIKNINYLLDIISDRLGLDHDRVLFGRYAFPVMVRYMKNRNGHLDDVGEQNKLLLWYLLSSLWGRYSNSTSTVIDKDLSLIEDTDNPLDELIKEMQLWQGNMRILPEHFRSWSKGSRFYPLLYLLTRTGRARDFGTGISLKSHMLGDVLEVHHIFPKSLLYKHGYPKEEVNTLANYCFLTKNSNNVIIRNQYPADYLNEVEQKFPGALESQWIPMEKELWDIKNYRKFLDARRELLAKAANDFIDSLRPVGLAEIAPGTTGEQSNTKDREFAGKSPDEINDMLRDWIARYNLPASKDDYELVDGTGRSVMMYDIAWPNGLREGLDAPVGFALQATPEEIEAARELNFVTFTQPDSFKHYIARTMDVQEKRYS